MSTWRQLTMATLQSSDYMSDELCHAILDYQSLVQTKQGIFTQLLEDKRVVQTNLISKEVELFILETELKLIEDLVLMRQSNNAYHAYENSVDEFPYDFYTRTNTTRKYAVMVKADKNVTFTVNFEDVDLRSNRWHVFKFENLTEIQGIFQTTDLPYYFTCIVVEISEQEFNQAENEYALIDKYNQYVKQSQVNSKQLEVYDIEEEIQIINSSIEQLQQDISIEDNFTPELIIEKNLFEIHKEWTDDNIIDVEELLELGGKVLEDLRRPKKILNISVVNFLKFIESQKDWNKLVLADKVTVRQNKFNINSQSRIIGIGIDFDSDSINLTIADTTDVETDEDKLIKMIYQSGSTSATVNMKKNKWDEVGQVKNSVSELLNNTWDASTRAINAGTNNSVTVDRRGLTIKDPDAPMKFLRGINSVLGITRDGGLTFEHAITADGIIGRQIIGEILIGQNLFMENESGTFMFDKDGVSIVGAAFNIIGGLPASEIDPRFGDVIDISNNNVITSIANDLNEIDGKVSFQTTAIQQNSERLALTAAKVDVDTLKTDLAELEVKADKIGFNFKSGGGVNLLKNSVGFSGTDFWDVTGNVQTRRNGELVERGASSGFVLRDGKIAQSVLTRNDHYTISTLVKKTSDGSGYFRVYNGDEVVNIQFDIGTSYDYEPFAITISPQSSQIVVEFFGDGSNEVTFTSIMANVGEIPLQWSHSEGEMYNSNVLMDINGIRVLSSMHNGYTAITPEEFAGYYDTNGDGQHEKVFYLDKDETVSKKFRANEEFTMGKIKIIKLESAGNNGWAFVPTTE